MELSVHDQSVGSMAFRPVVRQHVMVGVHGAHLMARKGRVWGPTLSFKGIPPNCFSKAPPWGASLQHKSLGGHNSQTIAQYDGIH